MEATRGCGVKKITSGASACVHTTGSSGNITMVAMTPRVTYVTYLPLRFPTQYLIRRSSKPEMYSIL